jgi:hypothetical protein
MNESVIPAEDLESDVKEVLFVREWRAERCDGSARAVRPRRDARRRRRLARTLEVHRTRVPAGARPRNRSLRSESSGRHPSSNCGSPPERLGGAREDVRHCAREGA